MPEEAMYCALHIKDKKYLHIKIVWLRMSMIFYVSK